MTNDSINQYVYDVEGRICAVKSSTGSFTQYVYDAEGRGVAKGSIAALPAAGSACAAPTAANGFSLTNVYLRGLHGDQDTELDGSGNWLHTNIFAAGGLTATYWSNGTNPPSYAFSDWLGTKRLQTNNNPSPETYWKSDPWGDYLYTYGSGGDATEHHFTGKEHDQESGNDYFGARYYASSMGRWMSPDLPFADQDPANPQSWNLYGYVRNNPLNSIDNDGLFTMVIPGWGYSISDYGPASDLLAEAKSYFHDSNGTVLNWPSGLDETSRIAGAEALRKLIAAHPNEPINIVAHSAGGNVALLASNYARIDNLITLGTPKLGLGLSSNALGPNLKNIGNWYNITADSDWVQVLGSDNIYDPSWARNQAGAQNYTLHLPNMGGKEAHVALRANRDVRNMWWEWWLNQQGSRSSHPCFTFEQAAAKFYGTSSPCN